MMQVQGQNMILRTGQLEWLRQEVIHACCSALLFAVGPNIRGERNDRQSSMYCTITLKFSNFNGCGKAIEHYNNA